MKKNMIVTALKLAPLFCSTLLVSTMIPVAAINQITHPAHHSGKNAIYPVVDYGEGLTKARIKNGEYLVTMSDCMACHTDMEKHGKPFAGGLGIKTPFGTIYSPNITPNKETGIGRWSKEAFLRAMQEGISPKGEYYYPVFPYIHFNKMSKQDILDMKAYLDRIPAVKQINLEPDMPIPFRLRALQFFWREMFFHKFRGEHKGRWYPKKGQSAQWNRGQYIVEGPAHCGMCHTPINPLGAQLNQYAYKGGFVDGYHAPDISSSHLGKVPTEKVMRVFSHNERIEGGGQLGGPMKEANMYSLRFLNPSDLESIVVYLKTVKSQQPPQAKHSNVVDDATGKAVYGKYCTGCHTTGAGGAPKRGDANAWAERSHESLETLVSHAIHGYNNMPAKGGCATCTDAEIKAATIYLVPKKGSADATGGNASLGTKQKALTIADGKRIYQEKTCHLCHDSGSQGAPVLGDKKAWADRIAQNIDVLYRHSFEGFHNMPPRGACTSCSDAEIIAAIKYMVQQSKQGGDYALW